MGFPQPQLPLNAARIVSEAETLTVGAGGDYSTIGEALAVVSAQIPRYVSGGVPVTIQLLSGFVMEEQVIIRSLELGFVSIASDDTEVVVARDALTELDGRWFSAFQVDRSIAPKINTLFTMDTSGEATERVGFYIRNRATVVFGPNSGFKNAGERNVDCPAGSALICDTTAATGANFSGAGTIGIRVSNGSTLQARRAIVTGCGDKNIAVGGSCKANIVGAILTDSLSIGLECASNSIVNADEVDVSRAALIGVRAREGRIVFTEGIADDCGGAGVNALNAAVINCGTDGGNFSPASITGCGIGLDAQAGARINAAGAIVDGAIGKGVSAIGGSTINFQDGSAIGCGDDALFADFTSNINAHAVVATGAGGFGANALKASRIGINNSNVSGALGSFGLSAVDGAVVAARFCNFRKGAVDDPTDARVSRGGLMTVTDGTGGISQTANTLTANGIIFQ